MGQDCPTCHTHGAFIKAITATGETARKPSDIIAYKLSCGHVVGNADYMEFRKNVAAIETRAADDKRKIDDKLKADKTILWSTILTPAGAV